MAQRISQFVYVNNEIPTAVSKFSESENKIDFYGDCQTRDCVGNRRSMAHIKISSTHAIFNSPGYEMEAKMKMAGG